jgi:hypothetical protein
VPIELSNRSDRLYWRVRYATDVGVSRWVQYCVHGCDVGAVMSFASGSSKVAGFPRDGRAQRVMPTLVVTPADRRQWLDERCDGQRITRGKHESIRRWWALEGNIFNSLSKMPEARPLQLRVQSIPAGQAIHITAVSHTTARKPQVGCKNHKCCAQG